MSFDLMTSTELIGARKLVVENSNFLTQAFFNKKLFTAAKKIAWDEMTDGRALAPFRSPCVDGKPMRSSGYQTYQFEPAYIKMDTAILPCDVMTRGFGEELNRTSGNPQLDRLNAGRAKLLKEHNAAIERRLEWMAANYLLQGAYTVEGDGIPTYQVDFNRHNDLKPAALAGAAKWDQPSSDPKQDIQTWANLVLKNGKVAPNTIIMSPSAYQAFTRHHVVVDLFKMFKDIGGALPTLTPQAAAKVQDAGAFGSNYRVLVYSDDYLDESGTLTPYLPEGWIILLNGTQAGLGGMQAYASIQNQTAISRDENLTDVWSNEYVTPSGDAIHLLTESAPLVGALNVNAALAIKVV